jgi:hypothetical protein
MAHFAELDNNNIVKQVVVVKNEELIVDGLEVESKGREFLENLLGGTWIQTSYNNNIRKQYASIGFTYDAVNDVFVAPQPYPSWLLDNNFDWQPPTPMPTEGVWIWDEDNLSWTEVELN